MEIKDLTGKKFGRLTAISRAEPKIYYYAKRKDVVYRWHCICDCGTKCIVPSESLRGGHSQSCGCLQKDIIRKMGLSRRTDLTGKKFGRLTVVKYHDKNKHGQLRWLCQCSCGNKCVVGGNHLGNGHTKSCGCAREKSGNIGAKNPQWRGGVTTENHKIRNSIEMRLWREAVFARDGWTCQECGQKGGKLNADHIKPFSKFPELRLALDNGVTLCVLCHRKTPTWGGASRIHSRSIK
jgi:5-methylcytosine-specific restriction endonuclease McrA